MVPAAVNLAGVRQMAWFQNTTVVLKFPLLLFAGVVGWFFVSSGGRETAGDGHRGEGPSSRGVSPLGCWRPGSQLWR
jgi:amino acid transporter